MEKYREIFKRGQFHLTEKQIISLIKSTRKFKKSFRLRNKIIVELLAFQGMRRFEVAKIELQHLNLEERTIGILGKKNIFRIAYIYSDVLLDDLKTYIVERTSGYLFPSPCKPGEHINTVQINRTLRFAGNFAGIKNPTPNLKYINPHILRHSCARILKDKGLNLEIIQAVLGHLSFKSTMDVYGTKSVIEINKELKEKAGKLFS